MHTVRLTSVAALVLGSAAYGFGQAPEQVAARHVIGLENVKRNRTGKLAVLDGALQFQAGELNAKVATASIENIFIGSETTQAGGKTGTVAKTAAIAAPYDSGAALSILLRTNVDVLTVSNRDSGGGLHYTILALAKGQGEQERTQLVGAGAHSIAAPAQESKEAPPAAPQSSKDTHAGKWSASAVQIEPVDAGDVWIPAEFRAAIYEFLILRVRESGAFQQVFRSGDRAAASVPDLVTLRTTVEKFKQGSQMERELTTVLGATSVDVSASATDRGGRVLMSRRVKGKVRFFGENLNATNDLAKRIAHQLKQE